MTQIQLRRATDVQERVLRQPDVRTEWERTAPARALAIRLVAYRSERGLSQGQLAALIGVSQPQVSRWEAGDHMPTVETLVRLADRLGMAFSIEITPAKAMRESYPLHNDPVVEEALTDHGSHLVMSIT